MSSLTWSLGRYNVSHCGTPSSSSASSSSWRQPSSRGTSSCNCAFSNPAILPPAVPVAPEPPREPSKGNSLVESVHARPSKGNSLVESVHARPSKGNSLVESVHELPSTAIVHGDCQQERSGLLQSLLSVVVALVMTIGVQGAPSSRETFEDVPQTLSGGDKRQRIQKPKSAKAESCTRKCVSTCIRGGAGAPGEGPLNVRRPLVVFKEGFRSRNYCLIECSEICNLIGDGDDGP